jgi:hypothetical protein
MQILLTLVVALFAYAIVSLMWWKTVPLPGPKWVVPYFGSVVQMVRNPTDFWFRQGDYGTVSANMLFNRLVVYVTKPTAVERLLKNNE